MFLECRQREHQSRRGTGNQLGKEKEDAQKKRTNQPSREAQTLKRKTDDLERMAADKTGWRLLLSALCSNGRASKRLWRGQESGGLCRRTGAGYGLP